MLRRLCLAAISALSLTPAAAALAATPGPAQLPSSLADPVETGFVEVALDTRGYLEGYFDGTQYGQNAGPDPESRIGIADSLVSAHFMTGYGRMFYMPGKADRLYEVVMVFRDRAGATSIANADKVGYATSSTFARSVAVGIPNAFGLEETNGQYNWTVVEFTKSNYLFVVARGADSKFMTSEALAQAEKTYRQASNGTAVAQPIAPANALADGIRSHAGIGLLVALIIGGVLAGIVFFVFRPRRTMRVGPDS